MSTKRKFIGAVCARVACRQPFLLVEDINWTPDLKLYCTARCRTISKRYRASNRCQVASCVRYLSRSGAIVCDTCWNRITGMCRGKRRHSEPAARDVAARRQRPAKWCRVCGWWHNTSHEVEDEAALHAQVGEILEALRKARGQPWILELIESWDPAVTSRAAWLERRAEIRNQMNSSELH